MCLIVLFGGSGDLSRKKLMPSLYNLQCQGKLSEDCHVFAIGRRERNEKEYIKALKEGAFSNSRLGGDERAWKSLSSRIYYRNFDFGDGAAYERLEAEMSKLENEKGLSGSRIYYMAVSPDYFTLITDSIGKAGMNKGAKGSYRRLVIEKPFGRSLESARLLNCEISRVFPEKDIYRIDHYLAKEMIQNIMGIRFSNAIFEPLWSRDNIDNIQISVCEKDGVQGRGGYYDGAGALRDMVQNHIMQMISLICMEPPISLEADEIRDEKVKVIKHIEKIKGGNLKERMVLGQYSAGNVDGGDVAGYRDEEGVPSDSATETFAALKLEVANRRWKGVPVYIRTGKRMSRKLAQIVVQFKTFCQIHGFEPYKEPMPNLLVIRVQPKDGVFFQFNMKKPGSTEEIVTQQMDYCRSCEYSENTPQAYERLFEDVIKGDASLFTRWDEIEGSWKIIDEILSGCTREEQNMQFYEAGSMGPDESEELLQREGRRWWNI
ncbi:glucose-6-phosphate 1-dehydrogenase [Peptoclostridium litorale DSM 5388]|uniref:Glucose-6-phosphate 1-dehydrogenase n=1 Tax=Peptoclostridium litorale DSM 5388 TaxID=1121324 RepID=A0A069RAF8_PEPLI|nr:glucose-6-phosphate dehydrogenase [Peptoclostridium litorale]KDR93793.1 glucose-6-phosphate 1-dehydrogenase Zwf [Peptoclostridium litorale DSM 5388]SIN85970.1 glucose-6-phosphate 1-dehydrogenase [Peptoclostridium litorale DSM 5388]